MASRFFGSLRQRGIRDSLRAAADTLEERYHDWRLGIDTLHGGEHPVEGDEAYHNYHFTHFRSFRESIRRLGISPGVDVLLDYGSGKGRVVIFAAEFPFRRVIGVEMSPELDRVARANLERARPRLSCRDVELVVADATQYPVPLDVSVIYMYNPFHGHVLERVMQRIEESLHTAPRRIRLVYKNPTQFEEEARRWPWLVKADEFVHGNRHIIYHTDPERLANDAV